MKKQAEQRSRIKTGLLDTRNSIFITKLRKFEADQKPKETETTETPLETEVQQMDTQQSFTRNLSSKKELNVNSRSRNILSTMASSNYESAELKVKAKTQDEDDYIFQEKLKFLKKIKKDTRMLKKKMAKKGGERHEESRSCTGQTTRRGRSK